MRCKLPLVSKALVVLFALVFAVPAFAGDKRKKHPDRVMIEKMEAVPCGAKERGITGLGSVFGSAGIEHVDSDEKLCPQYMLRTDDMEYHVRPRDHKHPELLPVGQEAEFKISKDILQLRVVDKDHKMRDYQVVSMKPIDHSESATESRYAPPRGNDNSQYDKPIADKNYAPNNNVSNSNVANGNVSRSNSAPVTPPN